MPVILDVSYGPPEDPTTKEAWFLSGGTRGDDVINIFTVDIRPCKADIVADAHNLDFPDGVFDMVTASEVLEHLDSPVKALREWRRVLRPGGAFTSLPRTR